MMSQSKNSPGISKVNQGAGAGGQASMDFKRLDAELWFARRLRDHLSAIFTAETDADIRRERIRRCIVNAELDDIVLGKHDGELDTYASAFQRLYGQPLHVKQKPKGN